MTPARELATLLEEDFAGIEAALQRPTLAVASVPPRSQVPSQAGGDGAARPALVILAGIVGGTFATWFGSMRRVANW